MENRPNVKSAESRSNSMLDFTYNLDGYMLYVCLRQMRKSAKAIGARM
jgi:hypothetical protein